MTRKCWWFSLISYIGKRTTNICTTHYIKHWQLSTSTLLKPHAPLLSGWTITKGPITWGIFKPGVELNPVDQVEISALSVIQNSNTIKRTITWQNFQARAEFNHGVSTLLLLAGTRPWVQNLVMQFFQLRAEIIPMSYSSMHGSDYLLQENNMEAMELLFLYSTCT
jgi:hypothetical protein